MSSPEELTFVVGRWLRPIVAVLRVARRIKRILLAGPCATVRAS